MDEKDLIFTPFFVIILYIVAYKYRKNVSDDVLRSHFMYVLTFKLVGAICLGLVYYFYYPDGGDTTSYHDYSKVVYDSFFENTFETLKATFFHIEDDYTVYSKLSLVEWYKSSAEWTVINIAFLSGLYNFHTYTIIAFTFSAFSFFGSIKLYYVFTKEFPNYKKEALYSIFFMPSVFFWGSGLLKDSVTFGALCIYIYCFHKIFIEKDRKPRYYIFGLIAVWLILKIKIYIFILITPALFFWLFRHYNDQIKSPIFKILLSPIMLGVLACSSYYTLNKITEDDDRYSLDKIDKTVTTNHLYLTYQVQSGSIYHLNNLDGTPTGYLKTLPEALAISFFRPYLFEAKNVLMFLTSIESSILLGLFLLMMIGNWQQSLKMITSNHFLSFCLIFSIAFGFTVAITSGNFGTLVRYKIPMMPFFTFILFLLYKKRKNFSYQK